MKIKGLNRLGGLIGACALERYFSTMDARYWSFDPAYDPKGQWVGGPFIYAFWHEYIPFPVAFFGRCKVATITSLHQDAEIVTHLSEFMGFRIFRGSSTRGGTEALRHLLAVGKEGYHLTIMPDGPKGPRRTMSDGTIFMASRLGFPIIPTGMGYSDCWRVPSWDRFAIPKPFGRARLIFSEAIHVPQKIRRDELEEYRLLAQERLDSATREAEEWAQSGIYRRGEMVLDRRPRQLQKYREGSF
ncbi:MAG: lysophospholipid acyltransferase family protein [Planctomycetia bacterium]|nr:lysophospholipid acyltransferase family protein [Planctomycetia bacterium]